MFALISVIHKDHPEVTEWAEILEAALKETEEMVQPTKIFNVRHLSVCIQNNRCGEVTRNLCSHFFFTYFYKSTDPQDPLLGLR